ncbi:MAG: AAA family ATPase [Candidatus Omnitrophota bacterium]
MKKIPRGIFDFERLRSGNYLFIDKTPFLNKLEETACHLFFTRPQRFGKTLFLSLLECYYDLYSKSKFWDLFAGTAIYQRPTDERHQYLMLSFDFSLIDPDPRHMELTFLNHIRRKVIAFLRKYRSELIDDDGYLDHVLTVSPSPAHVLEALADRCNASGKRLYILIDEYDHFANATLATLGPNAYHRLTHGEGFLRTFFNALKKGSASAKGAMTRSFITGISPIVMADLTSGHGIGRNISRDPVFNALLGFTAEEVEAVITYYRSMTRIDDPPAYVLHILNQWYGNHRFSDQAAEPLMNADMVMYFLKVYLMRKKIPKSLTDKNVRLDYATHRRLFLGDNPTMQLTNGNADRLREIILKDDIRSDIESEFPFKKITARKNCFSFLFYFGLLSIKAATEPNPQLEIPNLTARKLCFEYLKDAYDETRTFTLPLTVLKQLMTEMAYRGDWNNVLHYLTGKMRESDALTDLIRCSQSIQSFLMVYLGLADPYLIHAGKESNKNWADILLEPMIDRYKDIRYSYVLKIKYLKKDSQLEETELQRIRDEASKQWAQYTVDHPFKERVKKTALIKLLLIFSGHHCLITERCEE